MPPEPSDIDRVTLTQRPSGWPVMHQTWDKLLFLHWPIEPARLRPLIPAPLQIDTFDGAAWVGVTPFTMRGVRPPLVPPLPVASRTHELNVRTYVHLDGVPGVWFLSLDASSALAVWGARLSYFLPYYRAAQSMRVRGERVAFRSRRKHRGAPAADFHATWIMGEPLPTAAPGTRDFFLIERYCLYAARRGQIYRARIHHQPWPLREARLEDLNSTMVQSHGLSGLGPGPLLHALAEPLDVWVWRLQRVDAP